MTSLILTGKKQIFKWSQMQFYIQSVTVHCSQQMGEASSHQDPAVWVLEAQSVEMKLFTGFKKKRQKKI